MRRLNLACQTQYYKDRFINTWIHNIYICVQKSGNMMVASLYRITDTPVVIYTPMKRNAYFMQTFGCSLRKHFILRISK